MSEVTRVVLAQVVLPPSEEHCSAGLCGQNACCTIEIRAAGGDIALADDEEEVYVLPLCQAHALYVLQAPLQHAAELYPSEIVDLPPWEQGEGTEAA